MTSVFFHPGLLCNSSRNSRRESDDGFTQSKIHEAKPQADQNHDHRTQEQRAGAHGSSLYYYSTLKQWKLIARNDARSNAL